MAIGARQIFLQAMLSRGVMTHAECEALYMEALAKTGEEVSGLDDWIATLNNNHLLSLNLQIGRTHCPRSGKPRFALVNIVSDSCRFSL